MKTLETMTVVLGFRAANSRLCYLTFTKHLLATSLVISTALSTILPFLHITPRSEGREERKQVQPGSYLISPEDDSLLQPTWSWKCEAPDNQMPRGNTSSEGPASQRASPGSLPTQPQRFGSQPSQAAHQGIEKVRSLLPRLHTKTPDKLNAQHSSLGIRTSSL